jgi:hypothetical protein
MKGPECVVIRKKTQEKKETKTKTKSKTKTKTKTKTNKSIRMTPDIEVKEVKETNQNTPKANVTKKTKMKRMNVSRAHRTIQTFMKKTEGKRKSLFLQTICADSGLCITFGKEKDKLMDFFQFNRFTYATFPTKTIGVPSENGFVKEIRYEREKYQAYAVLKSSKSSSADNLAYEYLVGKYINEQAKKFPVFLETYGLFTYKNSMERQDHFKKNELTSSLTPLDPKDIANVCRKTSTECILIQHLKNVMPLYKMNTSKTFLVYESPYVFYSIYFALHQLRKEFTHYDLHNSNILIFEPVKGKYLEYHYHLPNETVTFYSKYIVKIIDYGRCFFPGATDFHDQLMLEPACKSGNKLLHTFTYLRKNRDRDDATYFVNSYYKNESHDLKALDSYRRHANLAAVNLERMKGYVDLFKNIVYENVKFPHLAIYGTKENLTRDDKVRNVSDVEERLRKWIVQEENVQANQRHFKGSNKLGEFHIYSDGKDMEYKAA